MQIYVFYNNKSIAVLLLFLNYFGMTKEVDRYPKFLINRIFS